MIKRLLPPAAALALAACLLLGPVAGSSAPVQSVATSQAMAIRISIPGQAGVTEGYVSAPNDSATTIGGFSYPDDGSIVTSGAITLSATSATRRRRRPPPRRRRSPASASSPAK